jgi:hypothetical protein
MSTHLELIDELKEFSEKVDLENFFSIRIDIFLHSGITLTGSFSRDLYDLLSEQRGINVLKPELFNNNVFYKMKHGNVNICLISSSVITEVDFIDNEVEITEKSETIRKNTEECQPLIDKYLKQGKSRDGKGMIIKVGDKVEFNPPITRIRGKFLQPRIGTVIEENGELIHDDGKLKTPIKNFRPHIWRIIF